MKKISPLLFLLILSFSQAFASKNDVEYLNDAAVVAKVESFNLSGSLKCEFLCFLDMNYVDFEVEPTIYFQVGTEKNPTAFMNSILSTEYIKTLEIEQKFNKDNYKLKINFGKIRVQGDFKARLVIVENGQEKIIVLNHTSYQDEITVMNTPEDTDMCKADQFLKKIDFENLYKVSESL